MTYRSPRKCQTPLPKIVACFLSPSSSGIPRPPRHLAADLHGYNSSQQLTRKASYSEWYVPAHIPVSHPSLHPTGQCSSPACMSHTFPASIPYLPAGTTHLLPGPCLQAPSTCSLASPTCRPTCRHYHLTGDVTLFFPTSPMYLPSGTTSLPTLPTACWHHTADAYHPCQCDPLPCHSSPPAHLVSPGHPHPSLDHVVTSNWFPGAVVPITTVSPPCRTDTQAPTPPSCVTLGTND